MLERKIYCLGCFMTCNCDGVNQNVNKFQNVWIYTVFIAQAYQTSQYVLPRGGIFLGKCRSSFVGSSHGKMSVQSACALNTQYIQAHNEKRPEKERY
jgi:hypothetical protein